MPDKKKTTLTQTRFEYITQFESQTKAAEKLCMDTTKLNKLLKETQELTASDIRLICKTYHCSADYLLGLTDTYNSPDITYKDLVLSLFPLLESGVLSSDCNGNVTIQDPLLKYLISALCKLFSTKVLTENEIKTLFAEIIINFNYPLLKKNMAIKDTAANGKTIYLDLYNEFTNHVDDLLKDGMTERQAYIAAAKDFFNGYISEYLKESAIE